MAPLIPQHVNTHRFRVPDRTCANGIFYVPDGMAHVAGAGRQNSHSAMTN